MAIHCIESTVSRLTHRTPILPTVPPVLSTGIPVRTALWRHPGTAAGSPVLRTRRPARPHCRAAADAKHGKQPHAPEKKGRKRRCRNRSPSVAMSRLYPFSAFLAVSCCGPTDPVHARRCRARSGRRTRGYAKLRQVITKENKKRTYAQKMPEFFGAVGAVFPIPAPVKSASHCQTFRPREPGSGPDTSLSSRRRRIKPRGQVQLTGRLTTVR